MRSIFVFGSNVEGRHGKGAALIAKQQYGAIYGQSFGPQGDSYAIVTKELRPDKPPVTLEQVAAQASLFIEYARQHPELNFQLTRIGCGLAGFTPAQIQPLFADAPDNVSQPIWDK